MASGEDRDILDKCFYIVSHYNPEFVFDVEKNNEAAGTRIILWDQKKDYHARNQLFYVDHKFERIRCALNDFCLDIKVAGRSKYIIVSI